MQAKDAVVGLPGIWLAGNNKNEMARTHLRAKARFAELVHSIRLAHFEFYSNFQREEIFRKIV